jgi:hypothetical protein
MGLLSDTVFKNNPKAKNILQWIKEFGYIAVFVWLALGVKAEYQNGYNACSHQACTLCLYQTYNVTPNVTSNSSQLLVSSTP